MMEYPTHSDQPAEERQTHLEGGAEDISEEQVTQKIEEGQPVVDESYGTSLPEQEAPTDDESLTQVNDDSGPASTGLDDLAVEESQPDPDEDYGTFTTGEADQLDEESQIQTEETYGTISLESDDQTAQESPDPINELADSLIEDQVSPPVDEFVPQTTEVAEPTSEEQGSSPQENGNTQFTVEDYPELAFEEAPQEANSKKIALILSGGGARGAFQVGAEKYAREAKGYQWDIIAGVSVGALNGAMLSMHRYKRLMEIWDTISDDQVYTGGFSLLSLIKIFFGARSFYGNGPLQKLMEREFEAGRILDDLHVGAVSLVNGEYVQFTKESLELSKAILASASIPVVWPPVDVSLDHPAMVDGGVRNISPVGDVLELEPDELVIINCSSEEPPVTPNASANVLSIGIRALDIMQNEIFVNDMKEFLRINALVKEAEQQGYVLHHPETGRPLKYYTCRVIEPEGELGDVLDFSQKSVQAALKAGVRRAREVLGRP